MSVEAAEQTSSEAVEDRKPLSQLASERFGGQFKGNVLEIPSKEPAESTSEEVTEEVVDDTADTTNEAAEDTVEESTEEVTEEAEGATEYQEYEVGHVAALLGLDEDMVDVDDEGNVILLEKVNGEKQQVQMKELLANHQMYQAADQRLNEAKEKVKAWNEEYTQKAQTLEAQFAVAGSLIDKAEESLKADYNKVDWDDLRQNDPAEWSAKQKEFEAQAQNIQSFKQEALQEYQQSMQELSKFDENDYRQYLQEENTKLLSKVPEWKDEEKAKAEKKQLGQYLLTEGFTEQDVKQASDHRLIAMARKAMLYDLSQTNKSVGKKKIAKIPRVIKPGTPKSKAQTDQTNLAKLKERAARSGTVEDAVAYQKAKREASRK